MMGALCCLAIAALAAGQEGPAARSERAARAMIQERFDVAETLYRELVRDDPNNPGLLLNLGLAQQSLGKLREAAIQFRAVVKLQPETTLAWLLLGVAQRKLGEPAQAVSPLERVLEAEPGNRSAAVELAEALFDLGRFENAAQRFFHIAEIEPANPRAWQGLGTCYMKLAREAFDEIGRSAPGSAWWWALAGRERAEAGRLDAAYSFYREALAKDPGLRGVRGAIAEIYGATGHDDWAKIEQGREEKLPPPDCAKEAPECELRDQRYWQAVEAAAKFSGPRAVYWKALAYYQLAGIAFERLAELPVAPERSGRPVAGGTTLTGRAAELDRSGRITAP